MPIILVSTAKQTHSIRVENTAVVYLAYRTQKRRFVEAQ